MRIDDRYLERLVPHDMNVINTTTLKNIGQIIRSIYTNGGLLQDNLGKGIQVSRKGR